MRAKKYGVVLHYHGTDGWCEKPEWFDDLMRAEEFAALARGYGNRAKVVERGEDGKYREVQNE
jgi:hypothetical protein